jgi:AcrR family transcriptional regulator
VRDISSNWHMFVNWNTMPQMGNEMDSPQLSIPRRRPPEGGYARGEETRLRIIEAAFKVFADEGYLGASTRRIAAEAGVNPPALQYYFDSKDGLHRACGQYIVDLAMTALAPAIDRAGAALAGDRREAVVEALVDVVDVIAGLAMTRAESDGWSRFMLSCDADDGGPAVDVVESGLAAPIKTVTTDLVARALGLQPPAEEVRLRSILILSQLSALSTKRDSTLMAMGWPDFAEGRGQTLRAILADHVRKLVTG